MAAELASTVVQGAALVLTFDEALDAKAARPAAGAFTVTAGSEARAMSKVGVAGTTATLTLDRAVRHTHAVTVSYTPPAQDPLRDAAGTATAGLSGVAVTNETMAATDPTLSTLALSDVTLVPGFAGTTLSYTAAVEHTVRVTTVTAQARDHPWATVAYGGEDADLGRGGASGEARRGGQPGRRSPSPRRTGRRRRPTP